MLSWQLAVLENKMATGMQVIGTPGHSPALKYELQLTEIDKKCMTAERIDLSFFIFDELIPQLGIFQRVMKMLRQELYAAVYSDEYTAGIGKSRRPAVTPVQVPHFLVAKKITAERDKKVSKLMDQIDSLKEQLYNCEADLEKASSAVEASKYDMKESEAKVQMLTQNLQKVTEERDHLQLLAAQHNNIVTAVRKEGENKITALQETVNSLELEVKDLEGFKQTHQQLQKVFVPSKYSASANKDTQPATHMTRLKQDHSHSTDLTSQLLLMQNRLIDQYEVDTLLGNSKCHDLKLKVCQEKFKANIDLIETELSLLTTHSDSITTRLSHLSTLNSAHSHQAIVQSDHPMSPLVSQEQLLSKYSAMLFVSSDEGKTFYPAKEAQLCLSCGQKVVICPHWAGKEFLIQLPLHSTHIKVTRPNLSTLISTSSKPIAAVNKSPCPERKDTVLEPDFNKIWQTFNSCFPISRQKPRDLPVDTVLCLVKLFYASQLRTDSSPPTQMIEVDPFLTAFYQFMKHHYHTSNIGLLVCHDVLRKLEDIYQQRTDLALFCHVLAGSLDAAVFRYHLMMADFVDKLQWGSSSDCFNQWSRCVYSFLEEEELEQLNIEYTGYSKNQSNRNTVLDYILWLILKHREPLVLQMESQLNDQKTLHSGSMSEHEFADLCLSLCPSSVSDVLGVRLFSQSLAQLKMEGRKEESIPLRQLAYILSYVHLQHSAADIQEKLQSYTEGSSVHHHLEGADDIMRMSDIKRLM